MGVLKAKVGGVWVPVSQGWSPLAGGYIGSALMAADQTVPTGSVITDLTGVSVSWTADPSRRYRTSLYIGAADVPSGAATQMTVYITDAANVLKRNAGQTVQASSRASFALEVIETGLSGAQTRKARFASTANSTVIAATGAQTYAPLLVVEDITTVAPDLAANPAPLGWIGHATQTADQVVGTGLTDLPGLSVGPFTISATNRKILATATVVASQAVAAATVQASIQSTPAGGQGAVVQMQIGDQTVIAWQWVLTNVSGAYTIKVQASASAGTCTFKSSSGLRSHLVVQDIGG